MVRAGSDDRAIRMKATYVLFAVLAVAVLAFASAADMEADPLPGAPAACHPQVKKRGKRSHDGKREERRRRSPQARHIPSRAGR